MANKDDNNNADEATASNTIQLDTMSLEQLDQLKQREESRLQVLTQRFAALRQAAARLSASTLAVTELYNVNNKQGEQQQQKEDGGNDDPTKTDSSGVRDVFVPLTESVYIPGKIRTTDDSELLLVELGTGYYVEKNETQTVEFLQRKMKIVNSNSDNVTQMIQATRQNLESIAMAMRGKLIEIQARQQGQRHRASVEE